MNTDNKLTDCIDRLLALHIPFAIYRLPWQEELHLVMQTQGMPVTLADITELNDKEGFVMTPFRQTEETPIVLIQPDIRIDGKECIVKELERILPQLAQKTARTDTKIETDTKERYTNAFEHFHTALTQGVFNKLVLSRKYIHEFTGTPSLGKIYMNACSCYPRVMIYLCHTPFSGTWLGCTPEIILSIENGKGHTVSLAGTMPVINNVEPQEWSEKNRKEQAYVSEYIRRQLHEQGIQPEEKGPYTARAGEVVHLKTDFFFPLHETRRLGNLLKSLHPTPAVCGLPKAESYAFIHQNEKIDRRYYAGFTGWLSPEGDTQLYVNLRCMEVCGNKAVLYAGGGILSSSEVESEWQETQHKLGTIEHIL